MLSTPKSRKAIILPGLLLLLSQPFFTYFNYSINLNKGIYSPNADSIGIPIFAEIFFWILLLPWAIYGLIWATRNYPGKISLGVSGKLTKRIFWWNMLFAILIVYIVSSRLDSIYYGNFSAIADVLLLALLLLELRVLIIAKKPSSSPIIPYLHHG